MKIESGEKTDTIVAWSKKGKNYYSLCDLVPCLFPNTK